MNVRIIHNEVTKTSTVDRCGSVHPGRIGASQAESFGPDSTPGRARAGPSRENPGPLQLSSHIWQLALGKYEILMYLNVAKILFAYCGFYQN